MSSLVEVSRSTQLKIIASSWVANGLGGARAMALGTDALGLALQFLKSIPGGVEEIKQRLETINFQLKTAIFLTGSNDLTELQKAPAVIMGATREWLLARGLSLDEYASPGVAHSMETRP